MGNFWKIAFEQIILGVFMVIFDRKAIKYTNSLANDDDKSKFYVIWYACLFDLMLIPICNAFGIWRGYEVFYIPRLVLWCILLGLIQSKDKKWNLLFTIIICVLFYGWFWQRLSAKSFWYETNLMPYNSVLLK